MRKFKIIMLLVLVGVFLFSTSAWALPKGRGLSLTESRGNRGAATPIIPSFNANNLNTVKSFSQRNNFAVTPMSRSVFGLGAGGAGRSSSLRNSFNVLGRGVNSGFIPTTLGGFNSLRLKGSAVTPLAMLSSPLKALKTTQQYANQSPFSAANSLKTLERYRNQSPFGTGSSSKTLQRYRDQGPFSAGFGASRSSRSNRGRSKLLDAGGASRTQSWFENNDLLGR